jgi:hypothetical protein
MRGAIYLNSRPQAPPPEANGWARPAHWQLVWFFALLVAGLLVGVPVAASDLGWDGTEPENISVSEPDLARQPVIAGGSSGRMAIAWSDQRSGGAQRDIYAVLSDDNGHTWSATPEAIAGTVDTSLLPDALAIGDRIFVAWVDGNPPTAVYEAERTGTGVWEKRRIPSPVPLSAMWPRLAASADRLHVVFNAGGGNQPDILHVARPLTATAWPTATVVYTHTGTGSWYPKLAVGPDESTLHMVWEERASVDVRAIMYMSGTVNGADVDWSSPLTLSAGITLSIWPDIVADSGGNLHVAWGEQVGTGSVEQREQYVRYARYNAASNSWLVKEEPVDLNPVKVNELRPTDITPSLALLESERASGDKQVMVCVAWHGFREDEQVEPAEEVLLSCSEDGGQSWPPPQNASRSPGEDEISIMPSIAFDAWGRLHSAWEEHVGDSVVHNYEIYHAHALSKVFLPFVMRN